jgi:dihydrofolate reductase
MRISLIVAVADNSVIGRKGSMLPWHLGAELRRFKKITMGHAIIMGRTTHETIGRLLPGRRNIVISRDADYRAAEGCVVVDSVEAALRAAEADDEVFVIGGADVFAQTLPLADKIYLTRVHASPDGDTFFRYDPAEWVEGVTESHEPDSDNDYPYTFLNLIRK